MRTKPHSSSSRSETRRPFSFLHPFNKSLLSTYYVPSQVLAVGDTDEVLNGPLNSNRAPSRRERYKSTGPGVTGRQSHKLCSKRGTAKPGEAAGLGDSCCRSGESNDPWVYIHVYKIRLI